MQNNSFSAFIHTDREFLVPFSDARALACFARSDVDRTMFFIVVSVGGTFFVSVEFVVGLGPSTFCFFCGGLAGGAVLSWARAAFLAFALAFCFWRCSLRAIAFAFCNRPVNTVIADTD